MSPRSQDIKSTFNVAVGGNAVAENMVLPKGSRLRAVSIKPDSPHVPIYCRVNLRNTGDPDFEIQLLAGYTWFVTDKTSHQLAKIVNLPTEALGEPAITAVVHNRSAAAIVMRLTATVEVNDDAR